MERELEHDLLIWKNRADRLPLILRGARQVGKSFIIEKFGKAHFRHLCVVDFELDPLFSTCFETLEPKEIIRQIEGRLGIPIVPSETLLFLDEIQYCPRAILALRYFKEKLGELHVISAGSLLEFILHDHAFSFPVGRVEFMYLYPLSFQEVLKNQGKTKLLEALNSCSLSDPLPPIFHSTLLEEVKRYLLVGGMPAVVKNFIHTGSFLDCIRIQKNLLNSYKNDFGKYATKTEYRYLQRFFEKSFYIIGEHFKYTKVDPEARSRELKIALRQLTWAGLLHQVFATGASGLPLEIDLKENKFKLLFLDIGLLQSANPVPYDLVLNEDVIQINKGMLAEQFVGQELIAYAPAWDKQTLFFWEREAKNASSEVDYILSLQGRIIPVEVKAGAHGKLRSLHQFMQEKQSPFGLRISQNPLSFENQILSIPLYLINQIPRITKNLFY